MQVLWHKYQGGDIAISGDGTRVAVVSGNTVYLYDQSGANELWKYEAKAPLTMVAISKDGKYVAAAGQIFVYLFDPDGVSLWRADENVGSNVNNVAISDDGSYVTFGSYGQMYLFDRQGQVWNRVAPYMGVGPAVVSGNGQYVAGVNAHGICFYDRDITAPKWQAQLGGSVSQIAISYGGQYTVATCIDKNLYMYYISGNRLWSKLFNDVFQGLAMTPDGKYTMVSSHDNSLSMFNITGEPVWKTTLTTWAQSLAISDDGSHSVAGTYDNFVRVFDKSGSQLWVQVLDSPVSRVAMSSDGSYVVASTGGEIVLLHNGPKATMYTATATPTPMPTPTPTIIITPAPTPIPVTTGGGDVPVALIAGLLLVVVLGAAGGLYLMSRKGKNNLPSIEINIGNATEDDNVSGSVYVAAPAPGASLNGVVRLSGKIVRTIDGPGMVPVSFGLLPAGNYEFHVECTSRDINGNEVRHTVVKPFEIKEAVPEITVDAPPLSCAEGEAVRAKITLTNSSRHTAVFDTFALGPGETKDFWLDIDTATAGKAEKKVTITFKNKAGRNFTTDALIRYTIQPARPEIQAAAEPIEVPQDEKGLAKVVLTNVSDFVAVFDTFTLKKGESHTIEFLVEGKAPGDAVATMPISFKNMVGRRFDLQVPVRYQVYAVEPNVEVRAESVEVAGGQGFVLASLTNQSPHEAFFEIFSLKIGESRQVRLPIGDVSPGVHEQTVKVTYKNRNGRAFEKNVLLSYEISPEAMGADAAAVVSGGDALTMPRSPAKIAFVSHAHQDRPVADAIVAALEREGISCWIAPRDVMPGMPFEGSIMDAINRASIFVLVFSSSSNSSKHVQNEVREAWKRGIPIIPFRIEDVPMGDVMNYYISSMHWIDALTPPLDSHIGGLSGTIRLLVKNPGIK